MKWYALAAALWVVFSYDLPYSGAIRGGALLVAIVLGKLWIQDALTFEPFTVRIRLLTPLLADHKLATPEMLASLRGSGAKTGYSVLKNGVAFTLLRPGILSHTDRLVYWPDFATFSTDVDNWFLLEELEQPAIGDAADLTDTWCPQLELRHTAEGIGLAITHPGSYEAETVTTLPWSVFHIRQWRYGRLDDRQRQGQLVRLGWQSEPRVPGTSRGGGFELDHQYFAVEWSYI